MTPSPAAEVCPECQAAEKLAWAVFSEAGEKRGGLTSMPTKCEKHRAPPAPEQKPCDHCGGTGKVPFLPTLTVECKYCNGTGVAAPAAPAPAAPTEMKCVVHRPDYSTLERLEVADNHALYQVGCRECSSTAAIVISDEDCHQWT